MRRVARMFVSSDAVADEVVQEAWVGVLKGLPGYEGRASLRTWIFRILVNIAKGRGQREARSVPFATLAGEDLDAPTWDPSAFDATGVWFGPLAGGAPDAPGGARGALEAPGVGSPLPFAGGGRRDERAPGGKTLGVSGGATRALPPMQAEVIRLRDVLGWSSDEVRNA